MKDSIIFLLDPGHGGIDPSGNYTTAPAKMFKFEDGFTIYEGYFNREIVKKLEHKLKTLGIPFFNVAHPYKDTPLRDRVAVANEIAEKWNGQAVYISIHGNAGKGTGFEVYTSKGETMSDPIAEYYLDAMAELFPDKAKRVDLSDGDGDKEANFYVLKNTSMPAILTESFFMDNREDAELMLSYEGTSKIVNAHLRTIEKVIENGLVKPVKKAPAKKKTTTKKKTTK